MIHDVKTHTFFANKFLLMTISVLCVASHLHGATAACASEQEARAAAAAETAQSIILNFIQHRVLAQSLAQACEINEFNNLHVRAAGAIAAQKKQEIRDSKPGLLTQGLTQVISVLRAESSMRLSQSCGPAKILEPRELADYLKTRHERFKKNEDLTPDEHDKLKLSKALPRTEKDKAQKDVREAQRARYTTEIIPVLADHYHEQMRAAGMTLAVPLGEHSLPIPKVTIEIYLHKVIDEVGLEKFITTCLAGCSMPPSELQNLDIVKNAKAFSDEMVNFYCSERIGFDRATVYFSLERFGTHDNAKTLLVTYLNDKNPKIPVTAKLVGKDFRSYAPYARYAHLLLGQQRTVRSQLKHTKQALPEAPMFADFSRSVATLYDEEFSEDEIAIAHALLHKEFSKHPKHVTVEDVFYWIDEALRMSRGFLQKPFGGVSDEQLQRVGYADYTKFARRCALAVIQQSFWANDVSCFGKEENEGNFRIAAIADFIAQQAAHVVAAAEHVAAPQDVPVDVEAEYQTFDAKCGALQDQCIQEKEKMLEDSSLALVQKLQQRMRKKFMAKPQRVLQDESTARTELRAQLLKELREVHEAGKDEKRQLVFRQRQKQEQEAQQRARAARAVKLQQQQEDAGAREHQALLEEVKCDAQRQRVLPSLIHPKKIDRVKAVLIKALDQRKPLPAQQQGEELWPETEYVEDIMAGAGSSSTVGTVMQSSVRDEKFVHNPYTAGQQPVALPQRTDFTPASLRALVPPSYDQTIQGSFLVPVVYAAQAPLVPGPGFVPYAAYYGAEQYPYDYDQQSS